MTAPLSLLSGSRQNALECCFRVSGSLFTITQTTLKVKFSSFEVGVQKIPSAHYTRECHVLDGRTGKRGEPESESSPF